jgi:hypothetical protein
MITEEQIIEILKSYSNYTDRSRTDECVHESNFDLIAKELVKKLTIPVVVVPKGTFNCGQERAFGEERCKVQCKVCVIEYQDN